MNTFTISLVPELSPHHLRWRNDSRIRRWTRQCEIATKEDHQRWLKGLEGDSSRKFFGVQVNWKNDVPIAGKFFRKEPEIVGCAGLTSMQRPHDTAEFSLFIGPEYQKNGYGKEALKELIRYGFGVLDLHVIWGETFDGNPAWQMFQGLGFEERGRMPEMYYKFGHRLDSIHFSLLKSKFEEAPWSTL